MQYAPPTDHQFHINFEELSATATVKDSKDGASGKGGFQVRGGPWEKKKQGGGGGQNGNALNNNNNYHNSGPAPDTNSAQDFPAFGGGPGSPTAVAAAGALGDAELSSPGLGGESAEQINVGTAWARKNGF